MEIEPPDIAPAKRGGAAGPALPLWWLVLVLLALSGAFGLLGAALHRLLGLAQDPNTVLAGLILLVIVAGTRRPRSFRELGLVAAVGAAAGSLAMLCYLPFSFFANGLENASQETLLRVLGMAVAAALGAFCALRAFRRLGVPSVMERAAKERS